MHTNRRSYSLLYLITIYYNYTYSVYMYYIYSIMIHEVTV